MNCHICDKPTAPFHHEKTDITYYYCEACQYIFKSPECYQDLGTQEERYNLHENDENDAGYQAYFQRFLDFILPLVTNKPKTALDFGCGRSSLLASMLTKEGIACDYYDPIYHPDRLKEKKKYDLIVSTEVFEHLHQPREVFESLLERLEEGGYLALQTQFHPNDIEAFKTWYYHQDPTHIVFFTAQTFRVLCKKYGVECIADNGKNMVLMRKALHLQSL
ncbi:class I SAM-dependent methyltransferase [Sulfurovum sp. XGS-02]|uniref:class I SAM-dependent methyltransferase n=1 Tax=Sulfurovum sp. XGS-02 TaxID=2925411 RepID=UPI00204CCB6A|nr:class I SAM-dependent methyltransferase [Sulfurovum sp. XGS-02]UPT76736.1 class I SAM-dependent methyltransferase [Sulfurovum sp. XGS-02]